MTQHEDHKKSATGKRLKVVHLATTDFGGAGKAAYRLHKGLQASGIDSTMLVVNRKNVDPSVRIIPCGQIGGVIDCPEEYPLNQAYAHKAWEHWGAVVSEYPDRNRAMEIFTDDYSEIALECSREILEADIVNLHWIAGLANWVNAAKALKGKKIVWTMHDMNPVTGGCHYAGDCTRYRQSCGGCPMLGSKTEEDVSRRIWEFKNFGYGKLDLHPVSPSKWLARVASESSLLSPFTTRVIPNGFPTQIFKPYPKRDEVRRGYGVPEGAKVVMFGAESLLNERKGFVYLLQALKGMKTEGIVFAFFGKIPDDLRVTLGLPLINLGFVGEEQTLAAIYSMADLFVIPSLEDNLPNTVVEAMLCGVPVVGFEIGGIPDMVEHKKSGYLAPAKDVNALVEGINWCLFQEEAAGLGQRAYEKAIATYSLEAQAASYTALYQEILGGTVKQEPERGSRSAAVTSATGPTSTSTPPPPLPRISIVVPSYNQGGYLDPCLDSILSQNYPNLELIVMDGGSTDGSVEIIRKYQSRLAYWQSKPDGGHYRAVNEGFRRSTGEIMAWLNSDDKYHPGSLRLVADAFRAFPETSWITGSPTGWDAAGALRYMTAEPPLWSREKYLRGEIGPPHIQQESTFWRRSLWEAAGGTLDTELELAADMELWARFFRHAQLRTLHAPLGGFRSHPEQKTARLLERYNLEAARVVERERSFYLSSGTPPLQKAPVPLQVADVESRVQSSVSVDNFDMFTYSRTFHFSYFAGRDLELYGKRIDPADSDLKVYQDLLVYTFIRNSVPRGARILEVGGGASRVLRAIRDDYECWNLDKLEGMGNGPVAIEVEGFRLVRDYLGAFNPSLPEGYFDLVFSISVLEHVEESEENFADICRDLDRVLAPGGYSLHCFDVVARGMETWSNALLPYLFRKVRTINPWAPFEQLYPDTYVYAMSEKAYDRHWKPVTKVPFSENGFPLSYNVLWQKPAEDPQNHRYLVSAIVSTYNAERFFRGCLENLLRQTLYQRGELEIIVIDSGSQQNEGEIAREFMARHPHIVYRRTERETLYAAWNRGIALARGRFLTHANTDDRHRTDTFELMARALDRHPVGLVYVDALMTGEKNQTFERNSATKKWLLPDFDLRQALMECPFGCQVMWRAEAHREVGVFDPSFKRAGDYEFFLRLALKRGALHIPEPLVLYHESMDNLSYQAPREVVKEVHGFMKTLRSELPLEEIYPFLRQDCSAEAKLAALVDFGNLLMGTSASLFTDIELAKEIYGRALKLQPGHPEVIANIAVAELSLQRPDRALAVIRETWTWTPRLRHYLELLEKGEIPELDLIQIRHPGLDTMPRVKLPQEIRVPLERHEPAPRPRSSRFPTVVIDGVFFMYAKAGISRVWLSLLEQWAGSDFGGSIVLLDRIGTAPRVPGVQYRMVPGPVHPQAADRAMLQRVCDEEKADLFISTYHTAPLTTPSLFLGHDMIPELSGLYNLQHAQWQEKLYALQRASAFVAVSHNTARDMETLHPELRGRIEVAHCGIDRALFSPASEGEIGEFRSRYGLDKEFFLFVGKRTEQKNGKLLFQALSRLPVRDSLAVVCVGGPPELEPEVVPLAENADLRLLNLSDQELRAAYSCAIALIYPSTYEGFGLPLLEAMACDCPVITCHNSSIPEVAGAAALFVAEDDPAQLAAAMEEVRSPAVRDQLVSMGRRQVDKFSWKKMADTIKESICRRFAACRTSEAAPSPAVRDERQPGRKRPQPLIKVPTGNTLPRITIVTPSFNQARYLEECMDSVLSQNYPNLEYIVMDGGSTDGSVEIISKFEKNLSYWQSQPDGGQYRAINEGFRRSSGEIMCWLNSDDKLHPGALWLVADTFAAFPKVSWLMGNPSLFDADGAVSAFSGEPPLWSREKYLRGQYSSPYIQQESVFWRRALWEQAGSTLEASFELAADMELWARFFRHAQLYTLDAPLAGFRTHGEQRSARLRAEYHREADAVVERERQYFATAQTPLQPAPPAIRMEDLAEEIEGRISPDNFGSFTYSRGVHFPFFQRYAMELYGQGVNPASCDVTAYQQLLVYGFIRQNVAAGGKILQVGGSHAPILDALKGSYHCWQLVSRKDAAGSAPNRGIREVVGTIGEMPPELPEEQFDFVFSIDDIEPLQQSRDSFAAIRNDMERVLKRGAFCLNSFELNQKDGVIRHGGLLPYLFEEAHTLHRWAPFPQLFLDPYVYSMNREAYDRHRKFLTNSSYDDFGVPFVYNVLWSTGAAEAVAKPQEAPAEAAGEIVAPPAGVRISTKGELPRISLVIPSYNYGRYIGACFDSILSQNYPNLELIVLDGGSTDNTKTIIERHASYISYWRSHRDEGQYPAIEEGMRRSSGELMGWLNADDMFHPGAFETVSTIFSEQREVEWLMGRPNSFDEEGRQKVVLSFLPINSRAKYLADEEFIQQEGIFWRRGLWERSGGYIDKELLLAADLELWARFFRSARLFSVDALIAGFRDHPLQKSKDKAGYTAEAARVLAREREIFAAEKKPFNPPAPLPILVRPATTTAGGERAAVGAAA